MKLSTKGRYAVTAMLELAINASEKHRVTLADISEMQGISLSYLEQLFARLRHAGLVKGMRGPGGGYRLGRASHDITIAQIIQAVDEKLDMTNCEGQENCNGGDRCLTHELWNALSQDIFHFLDNISLGNLVDRKDQFNATDTIAEWTKGQSVQRVVAH